MNNQNLKKKIIENCGDLSKLTTEEREFIQNSRELTNVAEIEQSMFSEIKKGYFVKAPAAFTFKVMEEIEKEKKKNFFAKLKEFFTPLPARNFAMGMTMVILIAASFMLYNKPVTPCKTLAMFSAKDVSIQENKIHAYKENNVIEYANVAQITVNKPSWIKFYNKTLEITEGEILVNMDVKGVTPLIAKTKTATISIIGTCYCLKCNDGITDVSVKSGKVLVETVKGTKKILTKGMNLVIDKTGNIVNKTIAAVKEKKKNIAVAIKKNKNFITEEESEKIMKEILADNEKETKVTKSIAINKKKDIEFKKVPVSINDIHNMLQKGTAENNIHNMLHKGTIEDTVTKMKSIEPQPLMIETEEVIVKKTKEIKIEEEATSINNLKNLLNSEDINSN